MLVLTRLLPSQKLMWGQPPSAVRRAQRGCVLAATIAALLFATACSPRDVLSRRLAADLIPATETFRAQQHYTLQTGVVTSKDYIAPEYAILQHHGWISATSIPCKPVAPQPCWDVLLTPSGVDTIRTLVPAEESAKPAIEIPVAKREFVAVTGVTKQGSTADVEFTWKWTPLNEIGAALYSAEVTYQSTVGFRTFDDGWRVVQSPTHSGQPLDDALKNSERVP